MNDKNIVDIEGLIVNGYLEKLPNKDITYASMLICSPQKKADGSTNKLYHRVRFPVAPDQIQEMTAMFDKYKTPDNAESDFISVKGQLRYDNSYQPFILADNKNVVICNDIANNSAVRQKLSSGKTNNSISLKGEMQKVLHKSHIAATVMVSISNGKGKQASIPVTFDSQKNPIEWAGIVNGNISQGDSIKVSGKLDGKLYANATGKGLIMVTSVITENAAIKKKRLGKPEQVKPNQVK